MRSVPVAAIDLGSNTVRLVVASLNHARLTRHVACQEVTRLGKALSPGGRFEPAAARRTFDVIERFVRVAKKAGADRILVGATMAVRQASDGTEFMERIAEKLSVETIILSGDLEAEWTALGVMTAVHPRPPELLIFDLGGRSTEFALVNNEQVKKTISLAIGVVELTERYVTADPPLSYEAAGVRQKTRQILSAALNDFYPGPERPSPVFLVGTAGTTTTLAAMARKMTTYQPERINNFRLSRSALDEIMKRLLSLTVAERTGLPGLPGDRADIIVAGALVIGEIMDYFNVNHLIVSDAGLLEGIWLAAAGQGSLN
jgi:exopolyphosphatase / guanosine-5'-triphosphate,3'-diphosphate pyrophosphatase